MNYENILVEIKDEICLITMNDEKKLNALSKQTVHEFHMAMDAVESDKSIRVVLLTGAGKAFIAGADIAYMSTFSPNEARDFARSTQAICQKMKASEKIYVGVVNGYALGGGFEIALGCDILIASEKAIFGLPEVGLGLLPGGGGTQRLSRLIGTKKAMAFILTGDKFSAHEAFEMGIISSVVEADALLDSAFNLAGSIIKNAPMAVRYAKECVVQSEQQPLDTALDYERTMFGMCFSTADQKEGMSAFLEKRPSKFSKTL